MHKLSYIYEKKHMEL